MRKILIAVPLKGELSADFTKNLIELARARFAGVEIQFCFLEGAPIQQARNEIVQNARYAGYTELVMVDKDLHVSVDDIGRLLCHESAPFVAGLYCQRSLETFWHVQGLPGEHPDASGLMKVHQCAVGFSKIRLEVFDQLERDNPDRFGLLTDTGGGRRRVWEFFSMELVGPNTPAARLRAIKEILNDQLLEVGESARLGAIAKAASWMSAEPNIHMAEDYNFCAMLRASGIPIVVDTQLVVQHETPIKLPIPTEQLLKMISENWRCEQLDNKTP